MAIKKKKRPRNIREPLSYKCEHLLFGVGTTVYHILCAGDELAVV